jgi:hypothetical protein
MRMETYCSCECPADSIYFEICEYTGYPLWGTTTMALPTKKMYQLQQRWRDEARTPTQEHTKWALKPFWDWCDATVPSDLLESMNPEKLCMFCCWDKKEVRREVPPLPNSLWLVAPHETAEHYMSQFMRNRSSSTDQAQLFQWQRREWDSWIIFSLQ